MVEMKECFSFRNGFDYEEFKDMCNSFKKVKLHSKMKSDLLLTDYIFCLAMRRISIVSAKYCYAAHESRLH